jgi:FkbM family methyltransferase
MVRHLLKYGLRRGGFGLWKINSTETLNFENLLYSILRERKTVSFLHIGAHDGKSFTDPLYEFIRANPNSVSGVLVEPAKETFAKLLENLGDIDTLRFLNAAVHPTLKTVKLYQAKGIANRGQQQYATGLSSVFDSRLKEAGFGNSSSNIEFEEVTALTIAECVAKLTAPGRSPNVICIDTEGLDFDLVRSIDFTNIRPELIRFEHNLCNEKSSNEIDDYFELVEFLNEKGYQVFTEFNDAVAISQQMTRIITTPTK